MYTHNGKELVDFWGLRNFELIHYVVMGLKPYDDLGRDVYPCPIQAKREMLVEKQIELEALESSYLDFFFSNEAFVRKVEEIYDDIRFSDDADEKLEIAGRFEKFSEAELEKLDEYSTWQNRLGQVWSAIMSLGEEIDLSNGWEDYTLPADLGEARDQIEILLECFYMDANVNHIAGLYGLKMLPKKHSHGIVRKYNDEHKEIENRIRAIIESSYDEIALLYRGLTGMKQNAPEFNSLLKKVVMNNYEQNRESFENIRLEYLDDGLLYGGTPPNIKRDFVGKLLQILVLDKMGDDIEKNKYRKTGVASFYKRYLSIPRPGSFEMNCANRK